MSTAAESERAHICVMRWERLIVCHERKELEHQEIPSSRNTRRNFRATIVRMRVVGAWVFDTLAKLCTTDRQQAVQTYLDNDECCRAFWSYYPRTACRRLWVTGYCKCGCGRHRRKSQSTHHSIRTSARSSRRSCG